MKDYDNPKPTRQRAYAGKHPFANVLYVGYIAGATAEALRSQELRNEAARIVIDCQYECDKYRLELAAKEAELSRWREVAEGLANMMGKYGDNVDTMHDDVGAPDEYWKALAAFNDLKLNKQ